MTSVLDSRASQSMASKTKYAFSAAAVASENIDRETGRIMNVSLISQGPAIGHGTYVDGATLQGVLDALSDDMLPAYITHRGAIFDDRLTREVGYFQNFRIEGDRVMADFYAFESFMEDEPKRFNRLFELAETMPKRFGLSIVFSATLAWATSEGDVSFDAGKDAPDNALFPSPSLRVSSLDSADFVDSPAANARGLFSSRIDKPSKTMTKTELETLSQELQSEKDELTHTLESITAERDELTAKVEAADAEKVELSAKVTDLTGQVESLEASKVELTAKVEAAETELSESKAKVEEVENANETAASELAAKVKRISELEALIAGSPPVHGKNQDDDPQPIGRAERDQIIRQFAKDHNISEYAATVRLSREQPQLWRS